MAEHIKTTVTRKWGDLARKLIAFALGSLSASAIIAIGAYFGVEIPTALAAFLASAVGIVAGYFTTDSAPILEEKAGAE